MPVGYGERLLPDLLFEREHDGNLELNLNELRREAANDDEPEHGVEFFPHTP